MGILVEINNFKPVIKPVAVDHITISLMNVMYKLDLVERLYVTARKERMWDADELCEVEDIVGYDVHWAE
jgi:hypothetical protein